MAPKGGISWRFRRAILCAWLGLPEPPSPPPSSPLFSSSDGDGGESSESETKSYTADNMIHMIHETSSAAERYRADRAAREGNDQAKGEEAMGEDIPAKGNNQAKGEDHKAMGEDIPAKVNNHAKGEGHQAKGKDSPAKDKGKGKGDTGKGQEGQEESYKGSKQGMAIFLSKGKGWHYEEGPIPKLRRLAPFEPGFDG